MDAIKALTDAEILAATKRLRARERANSAALVAHLVEVEARGLFAEAGYPSMFKYLMGALGYPEDAAAKRVRVARLVRRLPVVLEHLADGRLHLSGAVVLAPHLTPGNAAALLDRGAGRSKRELEQLVADLAPRPAPATQVRRLSREAAPVPAPALDFERPTRPGADGRPLHVDPPRGGSPALRSAMEPTSTATGTSVHDGDHPPRGGLSPMLGDPPRGGLEASTASATTASATQPSTRSAQAMANNGTPWAPSPPVSEPGASACGPAGPSSAPRSLRTKTQPLGRDCYRVAFMASGSTVGKLDRLVALLSHQVPDGDLDACLDRALDVAIGVLERERFGSPSRRRAPKPAAPDASAESAPRTRHVPAAVRRAVFERDGGCCAYVAPDGRRCAERRWLEVHHAGVPFALGGSHEVDNLALFCRTHNQWAGRQVFGEPPSRPLTAHRSP